ncbi:MAG: SLC26A/SulP transporter family protein [Hyphomicrobiales bacterium]|nr:SLC26A/SulP transporter family protein [Hyphomicrobiales bacterium]
MTQHTRPDVRTNLGDLGPGSSAGRWFAIVVSGVICGVLAVVLSIGVGSLLFSNSLHDAVPMSIGLALASTAIIAVVVAMTSSIRGAVALVQEVPVVALAAVVAAVVAALPADAEPSHTIATVIVAVALATALSGICALVLGYLQLGAIIRYVPYPVIGGFLAGTGWLIVGGGAGLALGEPLRWDSVTRLSDPSVAANLGLTVALVVILALLEGRTSNHLMLPGTVLATLVLFNLAILVAGVDSDTLHNMGWLVGLHQDDTLWPPITPAELVLVDWGAVAIGMISMPIMVVMTVIALLLNDTGIELETRRDVDLDRELRSVGSANLLASVSGGIAGFPSVSLTLLALRLHASYRSVGLIVAVVVLTALLLGNQVLDVIPTFLLGGLLIWLGGSLIVEWLVRTFQRLDRWEYFIILAIFAAIVGIGFGEGMLFGLVAALLLFVFQYGQVDAVRFSATGVDFQSSAVSEERRRLLAQSGEAILIIRLQGFLFFGTADRFRKDLAQRTADAGGAGAHYVVIDFGRVTGIDSSTILSFVRLSQTAELDHFTIVLSGLSPHLRRTIERSGIIGGAVRIEPDVDTALKWCEDALLAEREPGFSGSRPRPIADLLTLMVDDEDVAARLLRYLKKRSVTAGTILIAEGSASDDIYLVESGHAVVEIRSNVDTPIRLARVGPCAIVGELAYYLQEPRTATVVSEEDMIVWQLTREAVTRLHTEAPHDALVFHQAMAAMLSKRLIGTNRILRFLAD